MLQYSTTEKNLDKAFFGLLTWLDWVGPDDYFGADNPRCWWNGVLFEPNCEGWYSTEPEDTRKKVYGGGKPSWLNVEGFAQHMPDLTLTGYEFPRRWNMLIKDYMPDDWDDTIKAIAKEKDLNLYGETGIWLREKESREEKGEERDGWHMRGNCMVMLSYSIRRTGLSVEVEDPNVPPREEKGVVGTLISRTGYLLPLGPLDLTFGAMMCKDIAQALGLKYWRLKWVLSQAQLQMWPGSVWLTYNPYAQGDKWWKTFASAEERGEFYKERMNEMKFDRRYKGSFVPFEKRDPQVVAGLIELIQEEDERRRKRGREIDRYGRYVEAYGGVSLSPYEPKVASEAHIGTLHPGLRHISEGLRSAGGAGLNELIDSGAPTSLTSKSQTQPYTPPSYIWDTPQEFFLKLAKLNLTHIPKARGGSNVIDIGLMEHEEHKQRAAIAVNNVLRNPLSGWVSSWYREIVLHRLFNPKYVDRPFRTFDRWSRAHLDMHDERSTPENTAKAVWKPLLLSPTTTRHTPGHEGVTKRPKVTPAANSGPKKSPSQTPSDREGVTKKPNQATVVLPEKFDDWDGVVLDDIVH